VSTITSLNRLNIAGAMAAGLIGLALTAVSTAYAETLPWLTESTPYEGRYDPSTTYPSNQPYESRDPESRYDGRYGAESRYDERYGSQPRVYEEEPPTRRSYSRDTGYTMQSDIRQGTCNSSRLPYGINKQTVGGALGGVIGGLLGSRVGEGSGKTVATITGVLAGMAAGSYLGKTMDAGDQYCAGQALEYAQDNRPVRWSNPDNNSSYVVTPVRTYEESGRYCRNYTTRVTTEGNTRTVTGTACRQPDGTWRMVE
jgi:surface antigen